MDNSIFFAYGNVLRPLLHEYADVFNFFKTEKLFGLDINNTQMYCKCGSKSFSVNDTGISFIFNCTTCNSNYLINV